MNGAANIFFMGKGGVGKSTSAALTALFLTQQKYRVLLISLDPAHNQSDIFEKKLSDQPQEILPYLQVMEIDQELWIRRYLDNIHQKVKQAYSYLTAFNLEQYFSVIKHSPGLEEYALILAFEKIRADYAHYDYLLFDMPPTALALKFFSLPSLSLIWIEHLQRLRRAIIEKRELITKIKMLDREYERDKVLNSIEIQRKQYQGLKEVFENSSQTKILLVMNPDKLSQTESVRIHRSLSDINIRLFRIICNKCRQSDFGLGIDPVFDDTPVSCYPLCEKPLLGISGLQEFITLNANTLEKLLKAV